MASYEPPVVTPELIRSYTGRYYSPELDTHYSIMAMGDSALAGNHSRHGDFEISILRENELEGSLGNFSRISVVRGKKNTIKGFRVSNGRVRNLWFEKQ